LGGLVALAEQMLGLPVRLGVPQGLQKMGEALSDPAYATVVGLIAYGNRLRLLHDAEEPGWLGKLWKGVRGKTP
jgi:cell division protein FtsA